MSNDALYNPHLEGEPFFWEGGPVGVMLSHGLTATPAEVRLLAEKLHERGYTVAGPLLPGHGTTPEDLSQTTWQAWTEMGEESYRQLAAKCEHVFVGGESTGALVALNLAANHPEIAGVLAYAPAIKLAWRTFDLLKVYIASRFVFSAPKGSIDVSDKWQGYPDNPLKAAVQLHKFQLAIRKRLSEVQQPVLVFQGRLDTTIHPTCGNMICSGVSSTQTEHHWMEKSTHVVMLDQELDEVTELTISFMEQALKALK